MRLDVRFAKQNMQVNVRMNQLCSCLNAQFANLQKITEYNDVDPYMGSYEITPKVDEQILPTAQKLMTSDLMVKAIPIFDVSNNSGGSTVYIGKELEIYGD